MRPNPTFEPQVRAQLLPEGDQGRAKVKCILDEAKYAARRKAKAFYGSRSGITSEGLSSINGTTTYKLFSSSDKDTTFSRDIEDLTTTSQWIVEKEIVMPESATGFVKQFDTGSGFSKKAGSKARDDNTGTLAQSLLNRLTVTVADVDEGNNVVVRWPGTTQIDTTNSGGNYKAWIAVTLSFNTLGLDSSNNNNVIDTELELLKASKFKIRLKHPLTADDPEDDVKVVQFHKILIKDETEQQIGLTTPTYTPPNFSSTSTTIDNQDYVTSVTFSSGSVTFSELDVTNTRSYPTFRFDKGGSSWSFDDTNNPTSYSFTYVSWFSIKDLYSEKCKDIASVVAARQRTWDDSIIVGELYKIGTGLAVCTNRTNGPFASEVDGSSVTVEGTFKTVRTGVVTTNSQGQIEKDGDDWLDQYDANSNPEPRNVATTDGHLMRCAIASVSTTRPCKAVEFGIKSILGIRITGLTNFDSSKGYGECDNKACLAYKGNLLNEGTALYTDVHTSNLVSTTIERYSFFYVSYREAGSSSGFTRLNNFYGTRSATSQAVFNYIQLDMPSVKQWEFQIEPASGYEVRNHAAGNLYVLDASYLFGTTQLVSEINGIVVTFTGVQISNNADSFAISIGRRPASLDPLGYPQSDAKVWERGHLF